MRLRFRLRYMFFDVYVVENPKLAHNYKPLRLGFSNNIYEGLNKAARLWNSKAMRYELSITNLTIDILWVDYPFTRLQPVTSCIVDSPAIYVMVVKIENTIWPPPPQISLYRRAALTTNSNHGTQPSHVYVYNLQLNIASARSRNKINKIFIKDTKEEEDNYEDDDDDDDTAEEIVIQAWSYHKGRQCILTEYYIVYQLMLTHACAAMSATSTA
jgi:hypothetical protein